MTLFSKAAWKDESSCSPSVFSLITTDVIVSTKGKQELEGSWGGGGNPNACSARPPVLQHPPVPDPARPPAQAESTEDAAKDGKLKLSLNAVVWNKAIKRKNPH